MGLFDNNIHLNGAGTTYQSFLRLADEAGTLTTDKSREIQQQRRDGLDLAQAQALALGAKHWSSANACLLQLQHELQA